MNNNLYQLEQNAVLNFILNERFFKNWEFGDKNNKIADLEIFITPECNQKCEYCYLHKRSNELYPPELLDHNNLIEKLHIFLTYLLEKNYHISETELFTGEIWHTDFGIEILEIVLCYLEKGLQIDSIIIPTNGYFIKENSTLNKIQTLINKYKRIGKNLLFSLSIDGAIVENESRPLNNGDKKEDDFYERAFSFAIKNNFFFHPMISAKNVHKWIENHQWFYKKLSEYGSPEALDFMTLEVRNDDWTDENIEDYVKFLKYNINFMFEKGFNKNIELFAKYVSDEFTPDFFHGSYIPYRLFENRLKACNCSIAHMLTVRLGDLMITPCHRLSIPELHYGQFNIENGKITGITANNTYIANRLLFTNNNLSSPKCDTCVVKHICVKGCPGSQYEHSGDPFMPIESVCKLFKKKIATVFETFEELGVISEWEKFTIDNETYPVVQQLLFIKKELEEEMKNEFKFI